MGNPFWSLPMDQWSSSLTPTPEPLFKPSQASNASRTILINNCDSPPPPQVISTPSSFHWRLPSLLTPNLLYRAPRTAESTSGTLRTVRKFVFLTETIKTLFSVYRLVTMITSRDWDGNNFIYNFSSTRNTWWWHQHAALCPSGSRPLKMKPSKSTRKYQTSLAEELKFSW